jgi:putative ABC transport system substrate-binding protein
MQRLLATAWCVALGIALMVGSPLTLQGSGVRSPLTPSGSGIGSPLTPSLSPLPKGGEGAGSGIGSFLAPSGSGIGSPLTPSLSPLPKGGEGAGSGGIQTPAQRALIAILQSGEGSLYDQAVQGFKTEMARRGYREGSTVEYLVLTLKATGKEEPVESLLKRSPKVVVAVGTDAAHTLKERYAHLTPERQPPVVFLMVLDPVAEGLIESMERSGTRFVGVGLTIRPHRQFRSLLDIAPNVRQLGTLYNPNDATSRRLIEQAREDAQQLGLELIAVELPAPAELPRTLATLEKQIDAFWLIPDPLCVAAFEQIMSLCLRKKCPLLAFAEPYVRRGAPVGVGVDFADQGATAAELVEQLLQGADPATMPMLTPRRLRTYYNLATARAVGLEIPDTLLNLADKVFQQ